MSTALGLLAFAAYALVVIGAAAAITWMVVKLTPPGRRPGS
ncbi:MAG TPA: hypothetical protein VKR79_05545 [Gaiellaceae bacterium]|nr:hypothetical protein [Gaiellaceae bacterium]